MQTQTTDKVNMEDVMRKARKLMAFTPETATEAEVQNATAILRKMLDKYQLSMADIREDGTGNAGEEVDNNIVQLPGAGGGWMRVLMQSLADGNECKLILTHRPIDGVMRKVMCVIGHKSDLEFTMYLFSVLSPTLRGMGNDQGRLQGYRSAQLIAYTNAFVMGAAGRIRERLQDMRRNPEVETANACTALAVIKTKAVGETVKQMFPRLVSTPRVRYSNGNGFRDGRVAGGSVALNRGIGGGQKQLSR